MAEDIYQKAWSRLLKEIESKTGWGKNDLKNLMLDCLINPYKKESDCGNNSISKSDPRD